VDLQPHSLGFSEDGGMDRLVVVDIDHLVVVQDASSEVGNPHGGENSLKKIKL
jgi:hypothetical protein